MLSNAKINTTIPNFFINCKPSQAIFFQCAKLPQKEKDYNTRTEGSIGQTEDLNTETNKNKWFKPIIIVNIEDYLFSLFLKHSGF